MGGRRKNLKTSTLAAKDLAVDLENISKASKMMEPSRDSFPDD